MSRRRPARPAPGATGNLGGFLPSVEWRSIVPDGIDLDQLAAMLHRYARWSRVGATDTLPEVPDPSTDAATTIDSIDAWLVAADSTLDLVKWVGRRRWAWQNALGITQIGTR